MPASVESTRINNAEQKNINNDKEKQLQNKIKTVVMQKFSDFSPEQKQTLIEHFNTFLKIFKGSNLATVYKKFQEILKNNNNNPSKTLETIKLTIERKIRELEYQKQKKTKQIISAKSLGNQLSNEKHSAQNLAQRINEKHKTRQESNLNIQKERSQIAQKARESFEKLSQTHKLNNLQKIQETAKTLPTETQRKLQKQGISADEYAKFLLSRESIITNNDNSLSSRDFLKTLQDLEKSLNITPPNKHPDQQGFHTDYILRNPDLQKQIKSNPDFQQLDGSLNFSWLKKPSEVFNFVKRFGSEELKKQKDQISSFFNPDETLIRLIAKNHTQYLTKNKK